LILATLDRIKKITGKEPLFYNLDLLDKPALLNVFSSNAINAIVHLAGTLSF
jgi:UDP-glucose 4-epimerase